MKRYSIVSTDNAIIDADRVNVGSKMLGRIIFMGAQEGDSVKLGDTLAVLDGSDLNARYSRGRSEVNYLTKSTEVSLINLEKGA